MRATRSRAGSSRRVGGHGASDGATHASLLPSGETPERFAASEREKFAASERLSMVTLKAWISAMVADTSDARA